MSPRKRLSGMSATLKQLRWHVWVREKLRPSDWQLMLLRSALAGILGALSSLAFKILTESVHELFTHSTGGVVESMRQLPWWATLTVPALGGLIAGFILLLGKRIPKREAAADYMETIVIGNGDVPVRASLVKSIASLFVIGSGGSIGREGPLVQLAAMCSSLIGRWRKLSMPQRRLLVACGASAGIASAYNAPIAGSFFVAEIILGSIAMESLGALVVSAVAASLTLRVLVHPSHLYTVPSFQLDSPVEMIGYVVLGVVAGISAPFFLRSLRYVQQLFAAIKIPQPLKLALGGLVVGALAIYLPEVCGNGYSVVLRILNGEIIWQMLILVLAGKWIATAFSFGSGAPGGVFTPSLFMGASIGMLFGTAVHAFWAQGAVDSRTFALVGMGAFLSAASQAPIMSVILLFEMTMSYDVMLPLLLCSVIAYFIAKSIGDGSVSLYGEALAKRQKAPKILERGTVAEIMKPSPSFVGVKAGFAEIANVFLSSKVTSLWVISQNTHFLGTISLHDIKPYLSDPLLAEVATAYDVMRETTEKVVYPDQRIGDALGVFIEMEVDMLPVVNKSGVLLGSLDKNDLLLALADRTHIGKA